MLLAHLRSSSKTFKTQLLWSSKSSNGGALHLCRLVAVEHRLSRAPGRRREKLGSLDVIFTPSASRAHGCSALRFPLHPPTDSVRLCKSAYPIAFSSKRDMETEEGKSVSIEKTALIGGREALLAEDEGKFIENMQGKDEQQKTALIGGREALRAEDEGEFIEKMQGKDEQQKREGEGKKIRSKRDIEQEIGPPPEKPLAGDCCGQGCEVCVWDTYWDEVAEYNKIKRAAEETLDNSE